LLPRSPHNIPYCYRNINGNLIVVCDTGLLRAESLRIDTVEEHNEYTVVSLVYLGLIKREDFGALVGANKPAYDCAFAFQSKGLQSGSVVGGKKGGEISIGQFHL